MKKLKQPTKKQIKYLQIALGMTGRICLDDSICDFILMTQLEMKRLGGKFSLNDACAIHNFINKKYEVVEEKVVGQKSPSTEPLKNQV